MNITTVFEPRIESNKFKRGSKISISPLNCFDLCNNTVRTNVVQMRVPKLFLIIIIVFIIIIVYYNFVAECQNGEDSEMAHRDMKMTCIQGIICPK